MKSKPKGRILPNDPLLIQVVIFIFLGVIALLLQSRWVAKNQDKFLGPLMAFVHVQRIQCEYCDGTGLIKIGDNPPELDICPVCFGVGGHYIRKHGDHESLCPACGGMGRIIDEETGLAHTCKRCDGRGLIRIEPEPPEQPAEHSP